MAPVRNDSVLLWVQSHHDAVAPFITFICHDAFQMVSEYVLQISVKAQWRHRCICFLHISSESPKYLKHKKLLQHNLFKCNNVDNNLNKLLFEEKDLEVDLEWFSKLGVPIFLLTHLKYQVQSFTVPGTSTLWEKISKNQFIPSMFSNNTFFRGLQQKDLTSLLFCFFFFAFQWIGCLKCPKYFAFLLNFLESTCWSSGFLASFFFFWSPLIFPSPAPSLHQHSRLNLDELTFSKELCHYKHGWAHVCVCVGVRVLSYLCAAVCDCGRRLLLRENTNAAFCFCSCSRLRFVLLMLW